MKRLLLLFCLSGIVLSSCSQSGSEGNQPIPYEYVMAESFLSLNNGDPWEVNKEVKPHVKKAKDLVMAYKEKGRTDYKQLADQLQAQADQIAKNCNMEGDGYLQFEKWLNGFRLHAEDLKEAEEVEASLIISQIQESFESYQYYFQ
jgi:hypothetical protein